MSYFLNDIAQALGFASSYRYPVAITVLATDSRRINYPSETLFFALRTKDNDGHHFLKEVYDAGVRCFVVSELPSIEKFPAANFILVKDTGQALQDLAIFHRNHFNYPVIGITGSNGKTVVKEWLSQLLSQDYKVVRSPKSYNSQVGVPLSVWQMSDAYNMAVFEAGISLPGEMQLLERIIQPELGIFTFLGDAHAEGFSDKSAKALEKLSLFKNSRVLLFHADDPVLLEEVNRFKASANPALQLLGWGTHASAAFMVTQRRSVNSTQVEICYTAQSYTFEIPYTDFASVHNAITAICMAMYLAVPTSTIRQKIQQLKPVAMRLEIIPGVHHCAIINDSYSTDLNSLTIALGFLQQQQQHSRHTVILSDVLQSGEAPAILHQKIAGLLLKKKVQKFIGIGTQMLAHAHVYEGVKERYFFESTAAFLEALPSLVFYEETILIKGARVFGFEKISARLSQKLHDCYLEINLNALRHNIKLYRSMLSEGVKLMCMVKAFSYGSGSHEIASLLQHAGVDYLGVAYADEGVVLRNAGIRLPIMVMNTEEAGFENIVRHCLEPELYSFDILKAFNNFLLQEKIVNYPVHIKMDTGMHRLGFDPSEIEELGAFLKANASMRVQSIFSHLAAAGSAAHDGFTAQQAQQLATASHQIETAIGYKTLNHIANTSAIHRHPGLQLNMVRLGIGLYGIDEDRAVQLQLQNVTTLKTTISQIKNLGAGESVGYSRTAVLTAPTTIATVRIGYADGYPRILSNGRGYMLVNGKKAPVIGSVCMDMTMIDITGIEANEGDEVLVFGEALAVAELALAAQTISYEILTNISQRVRRVYFEE